MTATPALFSRRVAEPDAALPRKLAAICLGDAALRGAVTSIGASCSPDVIFRWPSGAAEGAGAAMAEALSDLAAYPEATCLIEDVLHMATPASASDDGPGLYVAARATIVGRQDGPGPFGDGNGGGAQVRIPAMAELWAQEGRIRDAWIVRDSAAALAAAEPVTARRWAEDQVARALYTPPLTPDTDPEGPYAGRGARTGPAGPLADHVSLMMDGELAEAANGLDPACTLCLPGGAQAIGRAPAMAFWAGLRGALPGAAFRIEHAQGMPAGSDLPPRAALRWTLYGRHEGPGRFGAPSGGYLYVLGLTQAEFGPDGIRRLWTLIDDTAICLQAAASKPA